MNLAYQIWHHHHNRFLFLEAPDEFRPDSKTVRDLCKRYHTDGLLTYQLRQQTSESTQKSPTPVLQVTQFWNDDGGHAGYCGNAHICLAQLAHAVQPRTPVIFGPRKLLFRSLKASPATFEMHPFEWQAFPISSDALSKIPVLQEKRKFFEFAHFLTFGVPHLILGMAKSNRLALHQFELLSEDFLRTLTHPSELFPEGTNITFAFRDVNESYIASQTYERGCERFTPACGSGMIACWIVLLYRKHFQVNKRYQWFNGAEALDFLIEDQSLKIMTEASHEQSGLLNLPSTT